MSGFKIAKLTALAIGVAEIALFPGAATAQSAASESASAGQDDAENVDNSDIIVTGTLLRGVAAPGTQTISIGRDDAIANGATSTVQLLAGIPQLGEFNRQPIYQGVFNVQDTVNSPDLRNLAAGISGGGSPTLLLMDGHRLPGMGVRQTTPDLDVIPPGAIERVEIVTDGGSATYGTDAVGGVVNYITRRRFDGLEVDGRYGFADNFYRYDLNVTAGRDWGTGSIFATYSYARHDAIFGRDRDFIRNRNYVLDLPFDLTCNPGNVSIVVGATTTVYALPSLTPGNGNRCDITDNQSIYPAERRHSALAGLTQALNDNIEFNVRVYYTNRFNVSDGGTLNATATTVTSANPFYRSTNDANAGRSQSVSTNFSQILGNSTRYTNELDSWGVTPELKFKLGSGWQLRTMFNYGRGNNTAINDQVDTTAYNNLVNTGQINPYDLSAPVNAGKFATVIDSDIYGHGEHELTNARAIVDGSLIPLPGGDVKVAAGVEYIRETYFVQAGTGSKLTHRSRPRGGGKRSAKAVFGEVLIPIFGEGNREGAIYSLSVAASGRYDHYSDFGGTFNPRFAVTFEPIRQIKIRGSWGKSYQAPSLADGAGAIANTITALPVVFFPKPGDGPAQTAGKAQIFLSGGGVGLKPQTAKTWSAGADIKPIAGLTLSGTYYNVKFKDLIAIAPVQNASVFYSLYPDYYILSPTIDQVKAFASQAGAAGLAAVQPYIQTPGQVYVLSDGRRANFQNFNTSGVDLALNYRTTTSFGSVFAKIDGNYILTRKEQPRTGAALVDTVRNSTRLRLSAMAGAKIGDFRAQATLQRTGSFRITPTAANLNQTRIAPYNVVNLFFSYDVNGGGLLNDLSLTLNVDNVFDQDPPLFRSASSSATAAGYANGFTLGRLFEFGVRKKF